MRTSSSRWWLPAALVVAIFLSRATADTAATNSFFFVQITDTHFGVDDHNAVVARMVDLINQLPMQVEFVVHTGDVGTDNLDDGKTATAGHAILGRLKMPLYVVPGNHDIVPQHLAATREAFEKNFGPLCTNFTCHGVVFLLVYTEPLKRSGDVEGYDPIAWLKEHLQAAGGAPVIVCNHMPPVEDFYNNKMHYGWRKEVRARWESLLQTNNVKAEITGHFHRDEMHWLGDTPLYVAAPAARFWGRQPSFRLYEYRDGHLSYRTIYLE